MAKKSSTEKKEKMSIDEKKLVEKYADRINTAVRFGYYTAIPQTDMLILHGIYKKHINPKHITNAFCGACNMTVLKGLEVFLKKAK